MWPAGNVQSPPHTGCRATQPFVSGYLHLSQYRHGTCYCPTAMSKSNKQGKRGKRARGSVDRSATMDVVTQLEISLRNPHAAAIGAVLGGLVPWFGRTLAHGEIQGTWAANRALACAMVAVVIGCGAFSGLSVYKFGRSAFGDPRKALGFTLALEGVMLVSHGLTSTAALGVLILINGVSNGSVIALARDAARRKQEADARGAATRARTRASAGTGKQSPPVGQPSWGTVAQEPVRKPSRGTVSQESQESQESVSLQTRPARSPVIPVQWRRASLGDVSDAEIVSEKFLA